MLARQVLDFAEEGNWAKGRPGFQQVSNMREELEVVVVGIVFAWSQYDGGNIRVFS